MIVQRHHRTHNRSGCTDGAFTLPIVRSASLLQSALPCRGFANLAGKRALGYPQLDPQPPKSPKRDVLDALVSDRRRISLTTSRSRATSLRHLALEAELPGPSRAWLERSAHTIVFTVDPRHSHALCQRTQHRLRSLGQLS